MTERDVSDQEAAVHRRWSCSSAFTISRKRGKRNQPGSVPRRSSGGGGRPSITSGARLTPQLPAISVVDTLAHLRRVRRVGEQRAVVVRVRVDEARRDDFAAGINPHSGLDYEIGPDYDDPVIANWRHPP